MRFGTHLCEAAHAEEAVHGAGALVTVHSAQLRPPLGQVPVGVLPLLQGAHTAATEVVRAERASRASGVSALAQTAQEAVNRG